MKKYILRYAIIFSLMPVALSSCSEEEETCDNDMYCSDNSASVTICCEDESTCTYQYNGTEYTTLAAAEAAVASDCPVAAVNSMLIREKLASSRLRALGNL